MTKLSKLCRRAFERQGGLCVYCGLPMIPREKIEDFSVKHSLTPKRVLDVTATAEHLHARCDGGRDTESNIAAAHLVCNQRRHRMRPAPEPVRYAVMVRAQLAQGGWMRKTERELLGADAVRLRESAPISTLLRPLRMPSVQS